jgi:anaerobic selenocysteine-containing dehydrogenase
MAHVIVKEKLYNRDFINARTEGFSDYVESLEPYTPEWAEAVSGVPAESPSAQAARMYASAQRAASTGAWASARARTARTIR